MRTVAREGAVSCNRRSSLTGGVSKERRSAEVLGMPDPAYSAEREAHDLGAGGCHQEALGRRRRTEAGDRAERAREAGDAGGGVVGGEGPFPIDGPDGAAGDDRGGAADRRGAPDDVEAVGARPQRHQPVDAGDVDETAGHGCAPEGALADLGGELLAALVPEVGLVEQKADA